MKDNRAMSNTDPTDQDLASSAGGGAQSAEKHPSLTLLESGQNPGELLKAAREKAGLSIADISAQTKINERQIAAIESGDVSRLPPETFAKAFIKSYCKALKMDHAPVVLAFGYALDVKPGASGVATSSDSGRANSATEPKMPSSSRRLSGLNFERRSGRKSLVLGLFLAVAAVMLVFYLPSVLDSQSATSVATAVQDEPVSIQAPSTEITTDTVEPALAAPTDPLASGEPAIAGPVTDGSPSAVQPPSATSSNESTTAAAPTAAQAAPQAATSGGALKFEFREQSWVTVRDVNDRVLHSQLNEPGSSITVQGEAPFRLIVGNAQAVTVTLNDRPIDLSASTRGEVARLTVQ